MDHQREILLLKTTLHISSPILCRHLNFAAPFQPHEQCPFTDVQLRSGCQVSAHPEVRRAVLLEGGGHGDGWHHGHVAPLLRFIAFMNGAGGEGHVILLVPKFLRHVDCWSKEKRRAN